MSTAVLSRIDSIAETSIRQQAMPGCQVVVIRNGYVILRRSYGFHTYSREEPVENSDIYDLASVTKVAATTIGIMKLYDEGRLKLDTNLAAYLPGLEQSELRTVKIKDVLIHEAGFPAEPPIFRYIRAIQKFKNNRGKTSPVTLVSTTPYDTLFDGQTVKESDTLYRYAFAETESKEYPYAVAEGIYLRSDMPDSIYLQVTKTKLVKPIEYKYSDMSMYIMMQVLQYISRTRLDEYMDRNFYRPLGLHTTGYNPLKRFPAERIIPTEEDDIFRKQLMHGYVHDPIASLLGGVSGHAGLFSDGLDLAVLMQMVLNGGSYGGRQYFSSETVKLFTSPQPGSYRGLGWDHNYSSGNPMCADSSSIYTYGHTGFTGTCVWVDPKYGLVYVFLSNRIYPTAENKKLQTSAVRQRIHQVIYDAMLR
jgi:CubicO group peptidase (beta-lactamase class C family)